MAWGSRGVRVWATGWLVLIGIQLGSAALGEQAIGSFGLLFAIVVVAASGCVITSLWLLRNAHVDDSAELGLIAAYTSAVSILPLVHGLTLPGVLYESNEATMTSALWALPLAAVAAAPLVIGRRATKVLRHWRVWVGVNLFVHIVVAAALLVRPTLLPFFDMGTPAAIALVAASVGASIIISARHLRLYEISRRGSVLAISLSFAFIASANLVWVNGSVMTIGFWLAHAFDILGVFGVTIIAAMAHRRGRVARDVFRPLTLRDPLDALEYGLDPLVREFIADLERKDAITADHVRRTSETAIAVGEHIGLNGSEVRLLGLGALLHDVGKLRIDDSVLSKPGRLTDAEFDHVRQHSEFGELLVRSSPVLCDIAPIVRHHHERIDGNGYPDRLAGEAIPMLARVVSVCDAYDAMAHTRHYRSGMDGDLITGILREHAGSQWDADIVGALLEVITAGGISPIPTVLAGVGQLDDCACTPEPSLERPPMMAPSARS